MNIVDKSQLLKEVELFVLDMDGTFYLGEQIIEGAKDFLKQCDAIGKKYIFFTNNSSKSPTDYINKLARMDVLIKREQIMTSGDVTIAYLKKKYKGKRVYLLGTKSLEDSFLNAGIQLFVPKGNEKPEVVVVGFDMSLTYMKLSNACNYIREGVPFLATHLDINCPTETGFIPDCGAICTAIVASTGIHPIYLGKPFLETVEYIEEKTRISKERMAFVGDRIYTDVATGVNNGAKGILVLTGETSLDIARESSIRPDGIFDSLQEMTRYM